MDRFGFSLGLEQAVNCEQATMPVDQEKAPQMQRLSGLNRTSIHDSS